MAYLQVESHKPSRRGKPLLSIRARLIVVALLTITPLIFERVRGLERARAERIGIAQTQVVDLARGGAEAVVDLAGDVTFELCWSSRWPGGLLGLSVFPGISASACKKTVRAQW